MNSSKLIVNNNIDDFDEDNVIGADCCQLTLNCDQPETFRTVCLDCLTDLIICQVLWRKSLRSKSTDLIVKQEQFSINKALAEYEIAPLDL